MRVNIASIVANNYVGMENMDEAEYAVLNERQQDMAVDGEAMSKEMDMLTQTQAALESILVGLQDLKANGKGLSLESAKFVNIFLSDANAKLGGGKTRAALESITTDQQRLDIALEGAMDYLIGIIKSKMSFYMWIAHYISESFDDHKSKATKLKSDLKQAVNQYRQSGQISQETITGNFGDNLLNGHDSNISNSVIISNVKQYANKINDPAKVKALEVVSAAADDVIKKIRSNWFFSSQKDMEELQSIRDDMANALRDYDKTEQGVIGQGQYNLTFDDNGAPRLSRAVVSKQKGAKTFKPLNENELNQFSQELNSICDSSIKLADIYLRQAKKIRSIYGFTFVNNILRLGPTIAAILAGFVAGPIASMAASLVPSRDIMQAMLFTNYMDTLRTYMYFDAKQRERVLADGIVLIKKSTA